MSYISKAIFATLLAISCNTAMANFAAYSTLLIQQSTQAEKNKKEKDEREKEKKSSNKATKKSPTDDINEPNSYKKISIEDSETEKQKEIRKLIDTLR